MRSSVKREILRLCGVRGVGWRVALDLVLWGPHEEDAGQEADEDAPHPRGHAVRRGRAEVHVQNRDRHDHGQRHQDHREHEVLACREYKKKLF